MPARKIVPYVKAPDSNQIPGKSLFYTTAMTHVGYAMGLLVETNEGRPTKIEGNPDHPASLGSTDTFAQASIHRALRSGPLVRRAARREQSAQSAGFTQALLRPRRGGRRERRRGDAHPDRGHLLAQP